MYEHGHVQDVARSVGIIKPLVVGCVCILPVSATASKRAPGFSAADLARQ